MQYRLRKKAAESSTVHVPTSTELELFSTAPAIGNASEVGALPVAMHTTKSRVSLARLFVYFEMMAAVLAGATSLDLQG